MRAIAIIHFLVIGFPYPFVLQFRFPSMTIHFSNWFCFCAFSVIRMNQCEYYSNCLLQYNANFNANAKYIRIENPEVAKSTFHSLSIQTYKRLTNKRLTFDEDSGKRL